MDSQLIVTLLRAGEGKKWVRRGRGGGSGRGKVEVEENTALYNFIGI